MECLNQFAIKPAIGAGSEDAGHWYARANWRIKAMVDLRGAGVVSLLRILSIVIPECSSKGVELFFIGTMMMRWG